MITCLIVEDDPTTRTILAGILSDVAECHFATDGEQVLELLIGAKRRYDVVFLDIMLPRFDGHRIIRELRTYEAERGVAPSSGQKVIVASSLENSENVLAAYSQGCIAYVTKPFERSQILGELERLGLITHEEVTSLPHTPELAR